jgi:hypothetical protein
MFVKILKKNWIGGIIGIWVIIILFNIGILFSDPLYIFNPNIFILPLKGMIEKQMYSGLIIWAIGYIVGTFIQSKIKWKK